MVDATSCKLRKNQVVVQFEQHEETMVAQASRLRLLGVMKRPQARRLRHHETQTVPLPTAVIVFLKMKPVPEVVECSVVRPTSLYLRFRDGWVGTLDIAPALRGPMFEALRRPGKFREVILQDGTLVWPNGADICPSVLRYWCEIGRVCSQEELDAHFEAVHAASLPVGRVTEAPVLYAARRKKRAGKT